VYLQTHTSTPNSEQEMSKHFHPATLRLQSEYFSVGFCYFLLILLQHDFESDFNRSSVKPAYNGTAGDRHFLLQAGSVSEQVLGSLDLRDCKCLPSKDRFHRVFTLLMFVIKVGVESLI
jgi:hypothetical protein